MMNTGAGMVMGGHTAGSAYASPSKMVGGSLIGEATNEVASAADKAYRLANIVREFNDSIYGPQPVAGGLNKAQQSESPTRAQALRSTVASLNEALALLDAEVERLQHI